MTINKLIYLLKLKNFNKKRPKSENSKKKNRGEHPITDVLTLYSLEHNRLQTIEGA